MFSLEKEPKPHRKKIVDDYNKYKEKALSDLSKQIDKINNLNSTQIRRIYNILMDTNSLKEVKVFCEKKLGIDNDNKINLEEFEKTLSENNKLYFLFWVLLKEIKVLKNNTFKDKKEEELEKEIGIFILEMMHYKKSVESFKNIMEVK